MATPAVSSAVSDRYVVTWNQSQIARMSPLNDHSLFSLHATWEKFKTRERESIYFHKTFQSGERWDIISRGDFGLV